MQATHAFPHTVHWDSFQLADAVPRRLSELYRFELDRRDAAAASPANGDAPRVRAVRHYLPSSSLPARFRVD